MRFSLWIVCLTLSLTSCTYLSQIPLTEEFDGIQHSVGRGSDVSIFIVHGISGFSEGDPERLICGLQKELRLKPIDEDCIYEIYRESNDKLYGCLKRRRYCSECGPGQVRIYTLDWRASTWDAKQRLRWMDEDACSRSARVELIDRAKANIINNGMGDVALYSGLWGPEIRYPFEQALRWIHAESKQSKHHELVCISFSFGGVILMDTLDQMCGFDGSPGSSYEAGIDVVKEIAAFYMLSNPTPLFGLHRMQPQNINYSFDDDAICHHQMQCSHSCPLPEECPDSEWEWEATSIGRFVHHKRTFDPNFQIVSFNDPNDLAGYSGDDYVLPGRRKGDKDMFANATVRNVKISWLGFVNPITAHTQYSANPRVIALIARGCSRIHNCED